MAFRVTWRWLISELWVVTIGIWLWHSTQSTSSLVRLRLILLIGLELQSILRDEDVHLLVHGPYLLLVNALLQRLPLAPALLLLVLCWSVVTLLDLEFLIFFQKGS